LLKYEVHEMHVEGMDRYYLPLPKLTLGQLQAFEERLASSGFSVRREGDLLKAEDTSYRITISRSGLASSGCEMLDAISPAIPGLSRFPREPVAANPYFTAKKMQGGFEVQFFPRMEGLRIWTALRKEGKCGLTPDEKAAISQVLLGTDQPIECGTDYPTEGCSLLQTGRKQYYHSSVPSSEFASRLRTVSNSYTKNCYLPRSSVVKVKTKSLPTFHLGEALGEWCYLEFAPKSL